MTSRRGIFQWLCLCLLIENINADCTVDSRRILRSGYYHHNNYEYKIICTLSAIETAPLTRLITNNRQQAPQANGITFKNSEISKIRLATFTDFNKVIALNMSHSSIQVIETGAMVGLTSLQSLYLNNNNISNLHPGALTGLGNLLQLDLSYNNLVIIESLTFAGLYKITNLRLDYNKITSINETSMDTLKELSVINLENNNLTSLASNLFWNNRELSQVQLDNNKIKRIPNNLFYNYPQFLILTRNKIASISYTRLRGVVKLSHNELTSVSDVGPNVTSLNIGYNNIREIAPSTFSASRNIRGLWINENKITKIHADCFSALASLEELYLDHNNIETIMNGAFRHQSVLTILDLSSNDLERLEYGLFSGLENLRHLKLQDNKLKHLDVNVLYPLRNVTLIDISQNFIENFDANKLVSHLKTLEVINIDKNQMLCAWLTETIHQLVQRGIFVQPGSSFKSSNVQGIFCINERKKDNNESETIINHKIDKNNTAVVTSTEQYTTQGESKIEEASAVSPIQETNEITETVTLSSIGIKLKPTPIPTIFTKVASANTDISTNLNITAVSNAKTMPLREETQHYEFRTLLIFMTILLLTLTILVVVLLYKVHEGFLVIKSVNTKHSSCTLELIHQTD